MNELVSVVWTTHQEPIAMVTESLNSLNNQTYQNCEFILINDASTVDGMHEFLTEYVKTHDRFKYVYIRYNVGYSRAKNIGIQVAKGKYINFLDADMVMMDIFIQYAVKQFDLHSDCYIAKHYTHCQQSPNDKNYFMFRKFQGIIKVEDPIEKIELFNMGAFLVKRDDVLNIGMFPIENHADHKFYINLQVYCNIIHRQKEYLVEYPDNYENWYFTMNVADGVTKHLASIIEYRETSNQSNVYDRENLEFHQKNWVTILTTYFYERRKLFQDSNIVDYNVIL